MSNIDLKNQLDEQQMLTFMNEYDKRKKSMGVAYVLWFFLSSFGAHRFYTRRTGSAVAMLLLWLVGLIGAIIGFPFLYFALYVWVLVDAFLTYKLVKQVNESIERDVLEEILGQRSVA